MLEVGKGRLGLFNLGNGGHFGTGAELFPQGPDVGIFMRQPRTRFVLLCEDLDNRRTVALGQKQVRCLVDRALAFQQRSVAGQQFQQIISAPALGRYVTKTTMDMGTTLHRCR